MIVVDSNILAYLYFPSEFTAQAEQLLAKDPDWVAPLLWRSEFRNILAGHLRRGTLTLALAYTLWLEVEGLLSGCGYDVDSLDVLELGKASDCSAYDCEFVALAKKLGVKLATMDRKALRNFPERTTSLDSVSP